MYSGVMIFGMNYNSEKILGSITSTKKKFVGCFLRVILLEHLLNDKTSFLLFTAFFFGGGGGSF